MSVLPGATNTTIKNSIVNAVSTTVSNVGVQKDIVSILHSHSVTAGLLDAKERFDAPKCDEGTRTSMILGMKKFVQDGNAASPSALYWLHGPAGVGKSALAQSLSLLLKRGSDHAASFFFSRTSSGRSDGNQLILTLAYQLASNLPALRPFMLKVVETNPAILSARNSEQMQSLIIDPINKWRKKYKWSIRRWAHKIVNAKPHPRLILVDGLDECNDPNVQVDLILCIASAVRQLSIPMRFVITSRPESHILATFELDPAFQGLNGVAVTKMNLRDDEDADTQITTFLLKEFAEIRRVHPIRDFLPKQWPRPHQIDRLVSKSSKGFIYPATVIRYIKMPQNRPDECLERILGLAEIPTFDKPYELLDSLYRHIFESVPEANKPFIHDIFHFLVLPSTWNGATNPSIIEEHFGYPPGHVQHVLRDMLCLVEFTRNECIKILHASLPDFLLDKSRSGPLFIDIGNAHATVAASYLLCIRGHTEMFTRHFSPSLLDHLLEANMSNALLNDRILQIDLLKPYMRICCDEEPIPPIRRPWQRDHWQGNTKFIEGTAFMIAYLLVLVIRHGPQGYISNQIAVIHSFISNLYPSDDDGGFHAVLIMTPMFHKWKSTIYHECINRIFKCKVPSSQNEIREAVFELHFSMIAYFYREHILKSLCPVDYDALGDQAGKWVQKGSHYWANIVIGRNY